MNDIETRLRQIDPAGPPLGFDPDDVATKAAKRQRARRGVMATTVATLAVAVGAVVVLGGSPTVVSPAAVPLPNPEWELPPLPYREVPHLSSPHVDLTVQKARNLQHLKDVLPGILPGARDLVVGDFRQVYGDNDWDSITASVTFTDAQGVKGGFTLTINGPVSSQLTDTLEENCRRRLAPDGSVLSPGNGADRLRCEKIPQRDGSTLVIRQRGMVEEGTALHPVRVVPSDELEGVSYRTDGTNLNVLGRAGGNSPMDQQQITRLLTDPAFTLR